MGEVRFKIQENFLQEVSSTKNEIIFKFEKKRSLLSNSSSFTKVTPNAFSPIRRTEMKDNKNNPITTHIESRAELQNAGKTIDFVLAHDW